MNPYELVDEDSAEMRLIGFWGLSISEQCKLLKVSRSGYYSWKKRKSMEALHDSEADKEKKEREMKLVKDVLDAFMENPAFGYRKMAEHLKKGINTDATEKKVRLIYQKLGLKGASPKFNTSKPAKTRYGKFPYLLRNKRVDHVNQVWATDITYIKLPTGMVYLTVILDWRSRMILSWRLSTKMETGFCLEALHEAIAKYGVPAIFNTDCGSQYQSKEFIEALQGYGIEISNDGVGRCKDNIRVERTWKTIKYEFIFLYDWDSFTDLKEGLTSFIDSYNKVRPHEALGYQTPYEVYRNGCFPVKGDSKEKIEVA
ncbi:MAG: IS3 family transposase [Candidatus Ornithospirochaeta sp.]